MTNYELYLQELKNKYNAKNTGLNDNEINAQATKQASAKESQELSLDNSNALMNFRNKQVGLGIAQQATTDLWDEEEHNSDTKNWFEKLQTKATRFNKVIGDTLGKMVTEGIVDAGAMIASNTADLLGFNNASDKIDEFVKRDLFNEFTNTKAYRYSFGIAYNPLGEFSDIANVDNAYSKGYREVFDNDYTNGKWAEKIAQGIGSSVGFIALTSTGLGWAPAFTSLSGSGAEKALQDGANTQKATLYGLGTATVETLTEMFVGKALNSIASVGASGINSFLGTNLSGNVANNVIGGVGTSSGKSILLNLIKNFNEEGMEEVVSDLAEPILQMIYKESDEKDFFGKYQELFNENGGWEGLVESYISGGASAGLMGGGQIAADIGKYGSIKAVQYQNSVNRVIELNTELTQEVRNNDYSKYPNLMDNPKIASLYNKKQAIKEKIANDFKDWLETVEAQFDERTKNEERVSSTLANKEALKKYGEYETNKTTQDIAEKLGSEVAEKLGYKYEKSGTKNSGVDLANRIIYVNGKQTFRDYAQSLMHESLHTASDSEGGLVNAIVSAMNKNDYNSTFKKTFKKYEQAFLNTTVGKNWLSKQDLTLEEYNNLSQTEKANLQAKMKQENKTWFDEEIAADELFKNFTSLKDFEKVIDRANASGLRKLKLALTKAFSGKKNKPKNYDKIIKMLEKGIKENSINKGKKTTKEAKVKEDIKYQFKDNGEFDLTDEQLKELDDLMENIDWISVLEEDLKQNEKSLEDIQKELDKFEEEKEERLGKKYDREDLIEFVNSKLSPEAKEYFKDSVVKTDRLDWFDGKKNGKYLVPMFHGTPNSYMYYFDSDRIGKNGTVRGYGFYLISDLLEARYYSKENGKVIAAFVNITNPMSDTKVTITKQEMRKFVEKYVNTDDILGGYGYNGKNYEEAMTKMLDTIYNNNTSDAQLINEIYAVAKPNYDEYFGNVTKHFGWDGIIYPNRYEGTIVIAFRSNQIKDIDNTSPTESKDIRYQIKETDTEDNELSKEQREYFNNSKAVDEDGHLVEVYHGTTFEFYEFDKNKANPESNLGKGFYFSNTYNDSSTNYENAETSQDLKNKIERLAEKIEDTDYVDYEEAKERATELLDGKNPRVLEVYLNMENPVKIGYIEREGTILFDRDNALSNYDVEDFDSEDDYYWQVEEDYADDIYTTVYRALANTDIDFDNNLVSDITSRLIETSDYIRYNDLMEVLNDSNIFSQLVNSEGEYLNHEVAKQICVELGYDGFIDESVSNKFNMEGMWRGTKHYVVFESNQIKLTSNKKPTNNSDIRYQIKEDSEGEDLSIGLQKWARNDKFVDEEGRLLRLYHGTKMGGFMEFNDDNPIFLTPEYENAYAYGGNYNIVNTTKYSNATELINDFYENYEDDTNYFRDVVKIADDEEARQEVHYKIRLYEKELPKYKDDESTTKFIKSRIDSLEKSLETGYMAFSHEYGDDYIYPTEKELLDEFIYDNQYNKNYDNIDDDYEETKSDEVGNRIYSLYAKSTNPLTIECNGNNFLNIRYKGKRMSTDEIAKLVKEEGKYDGIIFKNIMDNGQYDVYNDLGLSDVYVVFNSNQVKAVDNYNPTDSRDIRYQLKDDFDENVDIKAIQDLKKALEDVDDDVIKNRYNKLIKDILLNRENIINALKEDNVDTQKVRDLFDVYSNEIQALEYFEDELIDYVDEEKYAKNLRGLKAQFNMVARNIGDMLKDTTSNVETLEDEVVKQEELEAKEEHKEDLREARKSFKKDLETLPEVQKVKIDSVNAELNDVIQTEEHSKLSGRLDKPIEWKKKYGKTQKPKYSLVEKWLSEIKFTELQVLIGKYQEAINESNLTEQHKQKAIKDFKKKLIGKVAIYDWLDEQAQTIYGKEKYNELINNIAPIKSKEKEKELKIIFFTESLRKAPTESMIGVKAQADLRKDGLVYTLDSSLNIIKAINKQFSDLGLRVEFGNSTYEFEALKIAMILNEFSNTQYNKSDTAIDYSNLTNEEKAKLITDLLKNNIVDSKNKKLDLRSEKGIQVAEFIDAQVKGIIDNEGKPSKVSKLLQKQADYFKNKIVKLKTEIFALEDEIYNLEKEIKQTRKDSKAYQKLKDKLKAARTKFNNEIASVRKELRQAYSKIRLDERRIDALNEANEMLKDKAISFKTEGRNGRIITQESLRYIKELGKFIKTDYSLDYGTEKRIAFYLSVGDINKAVELYANTLFNDEYSYSAPLKSLDDILIEQTELMANVYQGEGRTALEFIDDVKSIFDDFRAIFNGSEPTKLAKALSYYKAYVEELRGMARNTTKMYRRGFQVYKATQTTYKYLVEKNLKDGRSGNRYGGLSNEFIEMILNFAKGEQIDDDIKIPSLKLSLERIIRGDFVEGLRLLDNRWKKYYKDGKINYDLNPELQNYIDYLLDEKNPHDALYLDTYKKVLVGIRQAVELETGERKAKFGTKENSLYNLSQTMQEENNNLRKKNGKKEKFGLFKGIITPEALFQQLSGYNEDTVTYQIYQELINGEQNKQSALLEYGRIFKDFDKIRGFYKGLSKEVSIDYGDKTIKAEVGQLLSFYELVKRAQAEGHIANKLGGIEINGEVTQFEDVDELEKFVKSVGKELDLNNADNNLTKFLKASEDFFQLARKHKVDIDIARWGFTNVEEGFYFPIKIADSDSQSKISQADFFTRNLMGTTNYSWNKSTTGTLGAIKLNNILDVIRTHQNQSASYYGYGVVADNLSKLWNYKLEGGKTVRKAVNNRFDADSKGKVDNYLAKLMKDAQGIGNADTSNTDKKLKGILNKMRGKVATVALGLNPKVMFSQTASIPAAMKYIKAKYLIQGLSNGLGIGVKNGSLPPKPDMLVYRAEYQQTGQAEINGAVTKVNEKLMKGITAFDTFAINTIWKASLLQTRNADGTWNIEKATDLAIKTVFNTQPNYAQIGRSELMRSDSDVVKLFTMFQSQAQQNLSMLYTAINRIKYKKSMDIAVSGDDWKELSSALIALFVQGLVYSGMGILFKHLVNNDWKDASAKERVTDYTVDFFNDNLMGMLPIINNIDIDLTKKTKLNFDNFSGGYLDNFTDLVTIFEDTPTPREVATTFSYLTGLPLTNAYKWSTALMQYIPQANDYIIETNLKYNGKTLTKSTITNASTKNLSSAYYRMYNKKQSNVSAKTNNEMYRLYRNGYKNVILKEIPNSVTLNNEDFKINKSVFNQTYSNIGSAIEKAITSQIYKSLDDSQKAELINKLITTYYNASKKAQTNENMNILEKTIYSGAYIDATTLNAIIQANKLEATASKTRKQVITKYINSLRMTKANKYFIYSALGYSVDSSYYKAYLRALGLDSKAIKYITA